MGNKSRIEGLSFENLFKLQCQHQGILVLQMPLACKIIGYKFGRPNLIQQKSPFDFILIHNGISVYVDLKSFEGPRISHSMLTTHQVNALQSIRLHGCQAGYVVNHRAANTVVFYEADKLFELKPGQSLSAENGIYLGTWDNIHAGNLFV